MFFSFSLSACLFSLDERAWDSELFWFDERVLECESSGLYVRCGEEARHQTEEEKKKEGDEKRRQEEAGREGRKEGCWCFLILSLLLSVCVAFLAFVLFLSSRWTTRQDATTTNGCEALCGLAGFGSFRTHSSRCCCCFCCLSCVRRVVGALSFSGSLLSVCFVACVLRFFFSLRFRFFFSSDLAPSQVISLTNKEPGTTKSSQLERTMKLTICPRGPSKG